MELLCFLSWRVALLLLLMPYSSKSLNVRILDNEPVYVIPGNNMILHAVIESATQDKLTVITWERQTVAGPSPNRVTLATCPGSSNSPCAGTRPNILASVGVKKTTLQISGYAPSDVGDYIVTVTPQNGTKISARCLVRLYEPVHHVSVSINVSHSVLVCAETWGTDPKYSWLYNHMAVTQTVGQVYGNGTRLQVIQSPICGRFTCRVSNKLGYATASYTAGNCEPPEDNTGLIAAVVCVLLLLICGGLLGLLFWWRYRRSISSRERFH